VRRHHPATVTADASGARATRVGTGVMWNGGNEPHLGDAGVTYNPRDGKVYGYGPAGPTASSVFLARATATRATDVKAYEYWDQTRRAWQTQRLNNPTNAQALFANRELGQSDASPRCARTTSAGRSATPSSRTRSPTSSTPRACTGADTPCSEGRT
jgi:hypothetical protein